MTRIRRKKRRKIPAGIVWTFIVLMIITYITFYTLQTQRVLKLDKLNSQKEEQIQTLSEQLAALKERKDQLSLADVKQKAKETLGMKEPESYKALPHPRYWPYEK